VREGLGKKKKIKDHAKESVSKRLGGREKGNISLKGGGDGG